jgi:N-methylhydantoinase A
MTRIGVDTGGTFTDSVSWDEGEGIDGSAKVPTSFQNPAASVVASLDALGRQGLEPAKVEYLFHGTTTATNIALELSGPRIAYLTTRGCRDVPEIGRLWRSADQLYSLNAPVQQIVARRDRLEIDERLDWRGSVVTPLDPEQVCDAARTLKDRDVKGVAVCLLHAYANPVHELRVKEILEEELPGVHISISSEILSDHREYERSSTTILNAYVAPGTSGYLRQLDEAVQAWNQSTTVWVMQSNGGVISSQRAAELPVTLLLSGPSGGVVASRALAAEARIPNAITLDMGGTSCDVALLEEGKPALVRERSLHDMPIRVPAMDVLTIGAGGGSIARVNEAGQFTVGPQSAGATPGPACYGRGGEEPTVTDANLVLGVLSDEQRLGDEVSLDFDRAHAVCERLGKQLGLSATEAAWGIRRLADTAMAGAVRTVSVERGFDPRDAALIAFGAAGPMHSVAIAAEIGIPEVIVPEVPGCHCAVGHVMADVVRDYVSAQPVPLNQETTPGLIGAFERLLASAREELDDEGIDGNRQEFELGIDLRYRGQQSSLTVPVRSTDLANGELATVADSFHTLHERLYGFAAHDSPLEAAAARLRAIGRLPRHEFRSRVDGRIRSSRPKPTTRRPVQFGPQANDVVSAGIFERSDLSPGSELTGPAIITQADATTVVPPNYHATVDGSGQIRLRAA